MKTYAAAGVLVLALAVLTGCGGSGDGTPTASVSSSPTTDAAMNHGTADGTSMCQETGATEEIPDAKLYIEFNSTDDDTGVHGLFDTSGFTELCIYAPDGRQILSVDPQEQFNDLGMGGIFFESREPKADEVTQAEILADFPVGEYSVVAVGFDGTVLTGSAPFTHNIPAAPVVTSISEGDVVDPVGLVITWEPVTQTIDGNPVQITGYEVIITNEEVEDPNGLAKPIMSTHVPPHVTSLTIPSEFLESDVEYELEILALEESGNQTITVFFFNTQ